MAGSHSKRSAVRVRDSAPAISSANPSKDLPKGRIREGSLSYCPTTAISPFPARNARTPAVLSELRRWTVGYRHRYVEHHHGYRQRPEPLPVPFLPLQGRWLHRAGFTIGTAVRVLVTSGRLVLEVDDVGTAARRRLRDLRAPAGRRGAS
jgi:hypothetical protein